MAKNRLDDDKLSPAQLLAHYAPVPAAVVEYFQNDARLAECFASNHALDDDAFAVMCKPGLPQRQARWLATAASTPAQVEAFIATGEHRELPLRDLLSHSDVRLSHDQFAALTSRKLADSVVAWLADPTTFHWTTSYGHASLICKADRDVACRLLHQHAAGLSGVHITRAFRHVAKRFDTSGRSALAHTLLLHPELIEDAFDVGGYALVALADVYGPQHAERLAELVLAAGKSDHTASDIAARLASHPATPDAIVERLWARAEKAGWLATFSENSVPPLVTRPSTQGVPLAEITDPVLLAACVMQTAMLADRTTRAHRTLELAQNQCLDSYLAKLLGVLLDDMYYTLGEAVFDPVSRDLVRRFGTMKYSWRGNGGHSYEEALADDAVVWHRRSDVRNNLGDDAGTLRCSDKFKHKYDNKPRAASIWLAEYLAETASSPAQLEAAWQFVLLQADDHHGTLHELADAALLLNL